MPRSQFDQELNKMHVDLDRMCHLVVLAIENCVTAFREQDYELARDIIHGDKQINDVERSIEAKCLSLILKQQPVASDLRDVSTALKVVTDLERIGDQSADIAELILEMKEMDSFLMIGHIQDMAKIATKMVKESLDAFHQHDLKHALEVKKMDIKMDELFDQVKEDIIQMIKESNDKGDLTINFLMIAKYFERIGDHAVNIMDDALKEKNQKIEFSKEGRDEMLTMYEKVMEIYEKAVEIFVNEDKSKFDEVDRLEDVIDQMKIDCQEGHVKRMAAGKCSIESGLVFTDLVIGYERIADHAVNIAFSILSEKKIN